MPQAPTVEIDPTKTYTVYTGSISYSVPGADLNVTFDETGRPVALVYDDSPSTTRILPWDLVRELYGS